MGCITDYKPLEYVVGEYESHNKVYRIYLENIIRTTTVFETEFKFAVQVNEIYRSTIVATYGIRIRYECTKDKVVTRNKIINQFDYEMFQTNKAPIPDYPDNDLIMEMLEKYFEGHSIK